MNNKALILATSLTAATTSLPALSNQTIQTVDAFQKEAQLICSRGKIINQTWSKLSAEQLLAECRAKFETTAENTQRLRDERESGEYTHLNPQEYLKDSAPEPIKGLVPDEFIKSENVIWNVCDSTWKYRE